MSGQTSIPSAIDYSAQLAGLHDIHLPEPVAMWPLAPGWWALVILALILITGLALLQRHRRRSIKLAALRELTLLEQSLGDDDNLQSLATCVGVLIRRVVMNLPDGQQYANVHGQQWAEYLSNTPTGMPRAVATLLAAAPYAEPKTMRDSGTTAPDTQESASSSAIIAAAKTWIRRHA